MTRRLPNLNQLRAFEAAARHLSFKNAAEELCVTHAAVSHHIKALEADLGLQLFHRRTRSVELTEAARLYADRLSKLFDGINEATRALEQGRDTGVLRISVPPFFSDRFLMPRLARFHSDHPGLTVIPVPNTAQVDLRSSGHDAAIRYGDGQWPGLDAIRLHRTFLAPVAAPTLVEGQELPMAAEQIARMPLGCLNGQEGDWPAWFAQAGNDGPMTDLKSFDASTRAVDLAFSGQRVALISTLVVGQDVDAGRLVRLNQATLETNRAMHVVYPATEHPDRRILIFAEWLRDELSASGN